jgi:DNA-binding CsgD family transcriptional regulator
MRRLISFALTKGLPAAIVFLFCCALLSTLDSAAQTPYTLDNSPSLKINSYRVLPDKSYSIGQMANDTALVFKGDSLRASVGDFYWVKLIVNNPYPNNEDYRFSVQLLNYTLYQYNPLHKKWEGRSAGLSVNSKERTASVMPLLLQKHSQNVLYLKLDVRDIRKFNQAYNPIISLEKAYIYETREQFITLAYVFCCIVLISFSCYNLYVYFQLKDKAYLFFVIVQIGSLIYITGNQSFLNVLLPFRAYNLTMFSNGRTQFLDLNDFIEHFGVTMLFWGFLHFTCAYLRTKDFLPVYDKLLKTLAYAYVVLEIIPITLTITRLYYIDIVPAVNVFILIMIAACLTTGIVAYNRKISAAKHFLIANLVPTIIAATVSIYVLKYDTANPFLAEMAVLSQMFTFAVALIARIKVINEDLKSKEIEAIQLEKEITVTEYQRLLIEQENKHITLTMELEKEKNELLQQRLEANQRELVGNSLYIHQKNKLLSDLKLHIEDIDHLYPNTKPESLKNIQLSLKGGQYLDEEWDKFKMHFEQVHPSFFNNLQAAHPHLTKYELRLYAYFHINLSTKEIAALLNIAPSSVRQAKARLNKKMNVKHSIS